MIDNKPAMSDVAVASTQQTSQKKRAANYDGGVQCGTSLQAS
jgi:hypothetical protein